MINETRLRELHLRDAIPIQLGNLASSVKRLGFLVHSQKPRGITEQLFQECQLFAAWTISDANPETRADLEALQVDLAGWQNDLQNGAADDSQRADISAACTRWADRLLEHSGLLKTGRPVSV